MDSQTEAVMSRTNYLDPDIKYIKNTAITEWDVHAAGLSVLEYKQLLDPKEIAALKAMPKEARVVSIGKKIIKKPGLAKAILDGLSDVRKEFAEANGLSASDVLAIKKDAVFVIKKHPSVVSFHGGTIEFRQKGIYTSYMRLGSKSHPFEAYYSAATRELEMKGISDEAREPQKDHLLNDVRRLMGQSEKLDHDLMFKALVEYRQAYLSKSLDKETYRSLSDGKFSFGQYEADDISDDDLPDVDVSENFNLVILPLIANMI